MTSYLQRRILDAVDAWQSGYVMIRETGHFPGAGRIDALLVPVHWGADIMARGNGPSLIGVEVKTNRGDFLKGARTGQFERYAEGLGGLYVATFRETCKAAEIPKGIGHLVIHGIPERCVCRKHPAFKRADVPPDVLWKLLFKFWEQHREQLSRKELEHRKATRELGKHAGRLVFDALNKLNEKVARLPSRFKDDY